MTHHRILTLAAAIYIADTGMRWNRTGDGRRILAFVAWTAAVILAIPGILILCAATISTTPHLCIGLGLPLAIPLCVALYRRRARW